MTTAHPGWLAARTVHLLGGSRAFNGFEPAVYLYPNAPKDRALSFKLKSYGSIYSDLANRHIAPVGFEFLSKKEEVDRTIPTNWRPYLPWDKKRIWPCDDHIELYSQIGFAAGEEKEAQLWDLTRRISHQLRVCSWRLYQLSEAYHAQLHAQLAKKDFVAGTKFEDGFTWLGYLAVQVFLVDACVLRDYLAEFYAAYGVPKGSGPHITSMAGLKRHILNKIDGAGTTFHALKAATSAGGWLFVLGAFRDLVVHCVPLARAEARLWALSVELPIKGAPALPGISLPLPSNPSSVSEARSSPDRAKKLSDDLNLLTSASQGDSQSTDALVYCYTTLNELTKLAAEMSAISPISPKIPHFVRKSDGSLELQ